MTGLTMNPSPSTTPDRFAGWVSATERLCEWLAMTMLVVATACISVEIFARGLFNLGLPEVGEVARFCGTGLVFLTVPTLLARDEHVKVDFLVNLLSGRSKRALEVVIEVGTLAFCVLFLVSAWLFLKRAAFFSTPALSIPNWLYYLPALVGMVLTSVVGVDRLRKQCTGQNVADHGGDHA